MKNYFCILIASLLFLSGCNDLPHQPDHVDAGNPAQRYNEKMGEIGNVISDLKTLHVISIQVWAASADKAIACGEWIKQYWVDRGLESNRIYIEGGDYASAARRGLMFAPPLFMTEKTMSSPGFVTIAISGIHKDDASIFSGKNMSVNFSLLELCGW